MKLTTSNFVLGAAATLMALQAVSVPANAQIGEVSKPGFGKPVNPLPTLPKPRPTPRTRAVRCMSPIRSAPSSNLRPWTART